MGEPRPTAATGAPLRRRAHDDRGVPAHGRGPPGPRRGPHEGRRGEPHLGASCATASTRSRAGCAGSACARGDTVALMLGNRPEFHIADLAVMTLGATPFSIYQTFTPDQIAYIVGDAGAKVAIVEERSWSVPRGARASCRRSRRVDRASRAARGADTIGWATSRAPTRTSTRAALARGRARGPLTLIYTSGTTGPPKGVQLAHRNLMAGARAADDDHPLPRRRAA